MAYYQDVFDELQADAEALDILDELDEESYEEVVEQEALSGLHISHYGKKGMKWGVRRTASQLGRGASPTAKKAGIGLLVKKGLIENTEIGLFNKAERARRGAMLREDLGKPKAAVQKVRGAIRGKLAKRQESAAKQITKDAKDIRKYAKTLDKKAEDFDSDAKAFASGKAIGKVDAAVKKVGVASAKKMAAKTRKQAKEQHEVADGLDALAKDFAKAGQINRKKSMSHAVEIEYDDILHQFEEAEVAKEEFIAHYGAKGMKWGIVKKEKAGSNAAKAAKKANDAKVDKAPKGATGSPRQIQENAAASMKREAETLRSMGREDLAKQLEAEFEKAQTAAAEASPEGSSAEGANLEEEKEEEEEEEKEKKGKGGGGGSGKSKDDKKKEKEKEEKRKKEKREMLKKLAETQQTLADKFNEESVTVSKLADGLDAEAKKFEATSKKHGEASRVAKMAGQSKEATRLADLAKIANESATKKSAEAAAQVAIVRKLQLKSEEWKAKAEENNKSAAHAIYIEEGDILHVLAETDDTVGTIIESLTENQKSLFSVLMHSAAKGEKIPPSATSGNENSPTVQEIFDTLSEEQTNVLYYVVGELSHKDNLSQEDDTNNMPTNIFEQNSGNNDQVLAHEAEQKLNAVLKAATDRRPTSLREAFENADITIAHSITNIDNFFPEAQRVSPEGPEFLSRPMEWVELVLTACNTRPFSRIKSQYSDITGADARAKGFLDSNAAAKVEEVITALKRETTPQTIYKLQKLSRDDVLDITEFNTVVWLKNEMRLMLREELARAILITDGRANTGNDAIITTNVRPIYNDVAAYTINSIYNDVGNLKLLSAYTATETIGLIDFIADSLKDYRGKGSPIFYCQPEVLTKFLLVRDTTNRRIHPTKASLAEALRVKDIVEVPPMSGMQTDDVVDPAGIPAGTYDVATLGVIVNLKDYVIGMDRGGQTSFFDDFDLDYNKYTYLYETRLSGALVGPKSAIAVQLVTDGTPT